MFTPGWGKKTKNGHQSVNSPLLKAQCGIKDRKIGKTFHKLATSSPLAAFAQPGCCATGSVLSGLSGLSRRATGVETICLKEESYFLYLPVLV